MDDAQDEAGLEVGDDEELGPEVMAYATAFAARVADMLIKAPDPRAAVEAFAAELASDEGAITILHAAFEDGRRDALITAARLADTDEGPGVTWEEVEGGERAAIYRETHLCNTCIHAPVCKVADAIRPEQYTQVRRCLVFVEDRG